MSSVMWDAPELAERYDRISDFQFHSGSLLIDRMHVNQNDSVLDVGCGTGRLAIHISKTMGPSVQVVGIDPSPYRIDIAKKHRDLLNVRFMQGQGEDLGTFTGSSFDHVYYSSVIHWIGDKQAAFNEAYRVLKPGGNIGMTTVDRNQQFMMKHMMENLFLQEPYRGRVNIENEMNMMISRDELYGMLAAAGFEDIEIDSVPEKHRYSSANELIDFIEASSFGNFLRDVPDDLRPRALRDIKKALGKMQTKNGIEIESHTMFTIARKPGS